MEIHMFFQEATPNTSGYMIAGYAISFIVMALYVASMYLRSRNLNQDMTTLEELDKPAPPPVQTVPKSQPRKTSARPENNRSAKTVTKKSRKK
jgi:hypothetical protein